MLVVFCTGFVVGFFASLYVVAYYSNHDIMVDRDRLLEQNVRLMGYLNRRNNNSLFVFYTGNGTIIFQNGQFVGSDRRLT
jgi:hypothetical protein